MEIYNQTLFKVKFQMFQKILNIPYIKGLIQFILAISLIL